METEVTSASAKTSPANVDRLEQEIAKENLLKNDQQIKLERHRSTGKHFISGMNTKYNFRKWSTNDSQESKSINNSQESKSTTGIQENIQEIRNLGTQTAAILYAYFDLPNWFSKDELYTLL
jgi:hypothetical protein